MDIHQQSAEFEFDPSDYAEFQKKLCTVTNSDPFKGSALQELVIGENAIFDLPAKLSQLFPNNLSILLVMDKTPMVRESESLKPLVSNLLLANGFHVETIAMEGDSFGVVHPDFEQVEGVREKIQPNMIVIALGSGVVVDICKYACYLFDKEQATLKPVAMISIPTANSVPAFSSELSIISKDGVKRTWPSRLPNVILYDLKILLDSPQDLILGGVGDMCGMFISMVEWSFGIYLGVVPDSPASRIILDDARSILIKHAALAGQRTPEGVALMARILTLGGLAMTFAKDSTPMSGYEHGLAHLLDMGADHFQRPIRNHGSQVAVAVIPVLIGLEKFLNTFAPEKVDINTCYPDAIAMEQRIHDVFSEIDPSGFMGQECWRDYQKKLALWKEHRPGFESLIKEWHKLLPGMKELIIPTKSYVEMLHLAGHPLTFEELGVKEEEAKWAYRNAYMLRKRLSTTDLMIFMDWLEDNWVDWVFAEARTLVNQVRET